MQHSMTYPTDRSLSTWYTADDLAHDIAESGVAAHEETLTWIAGAGARSGVSPTLLAAMLDRTAPEVTRQRAFGEVMRAMERARTSQPIGAEAPAVASGATSEIARAA